MKIRILAVAIACLTIFAISSCSKSPVDKARDFVEKVQKADKLDDGIISDIEDLMNESIELMKNADAGDEKAKEQLDEMESILTDGQKDLAKLMQNATEEQQAKIMKIIEDMAKEEAAAKLNK